MTSRRVLQHVGDELNTLRSTQLGSFAARGSLIAAGALALAFAACSAGDEADGMPTYGNVPAFGSNGAQSNNATQNPALNGATSNGSSTQSPSTSNGSNGNTSTSTPSAQQNGSQNNGTQPNGNQTGSAQEGNPNGAPISNGNTDGAASNGAMAPGAGGAMAPGAGGASNGAMAPGVGGSSNGNQTPPPANNGNQTPPPAAPDITCPSGAIFCSGFEGTGFPAGTTFEPSYLAASALGSEVELDSTVAHSGKQSLKMPVGHNYYRMLSVATPASYWVRLFARSTVGLGAPNSTHATFFMSSIVAPGGDYNADRAVEIAEQFGQVLLNVKDALYGTGGTSPNGKPGTRLPDNAWSCMEAQFDGATGDIHIYVEGDEIINASGWQAPAQYKSFRFGYLRYDSPARDVWMDDVIVAPSRVGCQ
jgi:hypothetical protein